MSNPFVPRGKAPLWTPIYQLLLTKQPGDLVTYTELSAAAGFSITTDRSAYYAAAKRYLEQDKRSLLNVRGIGYRVAEAVQHKEKAQKHQLKGKRQLRKAKDQVRNVRQEELTPEQRQQFDAYGNRLATLERASVNHEGRIRALEKAQTKTGMQVERHSREMEQIKARLKVMGYTLKKD